MTDGEKEERRGKRKVGWKKEKYGRMERSKNKSKEGSREGSKNVKMKIKHEVRKSVLKEGRTVAIKE